MSLTIDDVHTIGRLDERVREASNDFHNSTVLITFADPDLGHVFGDMNFMLKDVLELAVLTSTHTLVSGGTGNGKTEIVQMVASAAFGSHGWHILRLTPSLDEQTFANLRVDKLRDGSAGGMRECVEPAEFLFNPALVLDELNRTPPALTNVLLGVLDDRVELKFGVKQDVGHEYPGAGDTTGRYNLVFGTMNENESGREYHGTFPTDPALNRRFTITVPPEACRQNSDDNFRILTGRSGRARVPVFAPMIDELAPLAERVASLRLDSLAFSFLLYLMSMDHCPNHPTGYKNPLQGADVCARTECRVFKICDGLCGCVGGLSAALAIGLKRAAPGLAALRALRVIQRIERLFANGNGAAPADQIQHLRDYANLNAKGHTLRDAVISRYLKNLTVGVDDVQALLPFVAYGGKVWIAEGYVAKHFGGSYWHALRRYATDTYSGLEKFFRDKGKT